MDLYIRILRLIDSAFEMQLSFHVCGLSIRCSPIKLFLSNLSKKTKNILLFINFAGVKFHQAKHTSSLIYFGFLHPPQAHQIAHSALGIPTITHLWYFQRSSKTCNCHTPVFFICQSLLFMIMETKNVTDFLLLKAYS